MDPRCYSVLYQVARGSNSQASQWSCYGQFHSIISLSGLAFPSASFLIMARHSSTPMCDRYASNTGLTMPSQALTILKGIGRPRPPTKLYWNCLVEWFMKNPRNGGTFFSGDVGITYLKTNFDLRHSFLFHLWSRGYGPNRGHGSLNSPRLC